MNAMRTLSVLLLLSVSGVLHAQERDTSAQTILSLLDYVAVEYPSFVREGVVLDAGEYAEQIEFSGQVRELIAGLPANPERAQWEARADALHAMIQSKRDGARVAGLAREIQRGLIAAYDIAVAPAHAPNVAAARTLYRENCMACHGDRGDGRGPQAAALDPRPTDFTDSARAAERNVYGLYNTISLGVPGTAMPAFHTLGAEPRWQLAFYVSTFSAQDSGRSAGRAAWQAGQGRAAFPSLAAVAMTTPAQAAAMGRDAQSILAYLRAEPAAAEASSDSPLAFTLTTMQRSLEAFRAGDSEQAYRLAVTAYLEGFELAEASIDNVDSALRTRAEHAMMAYRTAIQTGAPAAQVEARYRTAIAEIDEARTRIGAAGISPTGSFISSLIIILREGLEAILVIAAMAAFMVKTGRRDGLRWLHAGWIAALALGVLTWVVSSHLITISGAHRELTEGVAALLSSAVLLYVGFWLHSRASAAKWSAFIRERMNTGGGTWWGVALVSFLAVYREAFETVLFYQALWIQSDAAGQTAVVVGLAGGALALTALAWLVIRLSVRLPLALFFRASSLLIAVLAVVFAGQGVAALQAAGRLAVSPLDLPSVPLLGIYPNLQGIVLQLLLLVLIVGGYFYLRSGAKRA